MSRVVYNDCPGSPSNQPKHMQSGSPGDATAAGGPHTGQKILINVSGKKFQIYRDYLERYPQTLLGSADLDTHWDPHHGDYFFDSNPEAFESIFDFYLYGKLYQPATIPNEMFQESVTFFRMMSVFEEEKAQEEEEKIPVEAKTKMGRLRQKTNNILQNPSSSFFGLLYGWMDLGCICLSIILMLFETDPNIVVILEDKNSTTAKVCFAVESVTVVYFTFDVLLRFVVTYDKLSFSKAPATWLDIFTVGPYYLELFIDVTKFKSLKVLRIARIARVLKLIKKNKRLLLIATVLAQSVSELSMLIIVWSMCILVAGCSFYYLEETSNDTVKSGVDGLWWAVVTMSTVGYGDIAPQSTPGKLFGTVFVYVSMVFLALPLTIIVGAFSKQYESRKCMSLKKNQSAYQLANTKASDD
ncbi:potassium voltage-gated channel protein shk-1-like isoform X2 [Bolinopsis microptera]|uniref:potassium voltage-gated channel protein shk-1-like isoform X2 n=1 Tax=Bolinopsis microptera TaxID=2820187 RepID=UPI00307B0784